MFEGIIRSVFLPVGRERLPVFHIVLLNTVHVSFPQALNHWRGFYRRSHRASDAEAG